MGSALGEAGRTVRENSEQGRRTLFLCFYAGHAEYDQDGTQAYLNCGPLGKSHGYELVAELGAIADHHKGSYLIALMACDCSRRPKEQQRGGTEATEPKIIGMGQ